MSKKDEKVLLTKNGKDNVQFHPKVAEHLLKNGWKKATGASTPANAESATNTDSTVPPKTT